MSESGKEIVLSLQWDIHDLSDAESFGSDTEPYPPGAEPPSSEVKRPTILAFTWCCKCKEACERGCKGQCKEKFIRVPEHQKHLLDVPCPLRHRYCGRCQVLNNADEEVGKWIEGGSKIEVLI